MRTVVYPGYGSSDVLQFEEIEKPTPVDNQVLVKVHASSVNAGDYRVMRGKPFLIRPMMGGIQKPKNPRVGSDVAGQVEAVGEGVKQFRPGDYVFGCAKGAFAEYVIAKETNLTIKPVIVPFEDAAAVPVAALTALQGLRDIGKIQTGQRALIQGASGGVGMFALQLAKLFGAEVTAVCSTKNLEMVRSIGADHVIDYTAEDFTRSEQQFNLIFAVNGYHLIFAYHRALSAKGTYVCAGGSMPQIFQAMLLGSLMSRKGGKTFSFMGLAKVRQDDLVYLGKLLETGKLKVVIDRRYSLDEIVEAFRYIEETHAQGKVVIVVNH